MRRKKEGESVEIRWMELKRVIQYSDLFPEQTGNLPDERSLVKGLKRESLCTITANMVQRLNGVPFYDNNRDPGKEEFDFVSFFLSDKDPIYTQEIKDRHAAAIKNLPTYYTGGFTATSKAAIMSFQRLFFSVAPEQKQDYSAQIEKDFSIALLLENQKVYEAEYDPKKYESDPIDLQLARLYLAYNYANEDVESSDTHDLFRRQLTKSVSLFTYLFRSKDKRVKVLRKRFLAHFHIGSWVEYLIPHVMSLHFLKENSGLLILKGSGKYGKKARRVIEKSCIDKDVLIPEGDNPDFMVFRGKPFIRLKKHHYAITNQSFVIEHMFNSVYFELKQYRKDARFLSDDEFRQYYTTEFSQKYMFEGYVNRILPHNTQFSITGSQCDDELEKARKKGINTDGIVPPDYFIRVPEGCIVFEYKDALTKAKVKESRDAEKLFADIKRKFFENEKGSHKGITQLLDSVKAIQESSFFFDKPSPDSIVYPVLVVDNPVYTMRGMHTLLDYMMREECTRRGMRSETLKPLVLMDVATLRLYSECFKSEGVVYYFEKYYMHVDPNGTEAKNDPFEALISFTEFMKDKGISNMGNVFDCIIREAKPVLRQYN